MILEHKGRFVLHANKPHTYFLFSSDSLISLSSNGELEWKAFHFSSLIAQGQRFHERDKALVGGEEIRLALPPPRARSEVDSETPCVETRSLCLVIWSVPKDVGGFRISRDVCIGDAGWRRNKISACWCQWQGGGGIGNSKGCRKSTWPAACYVCDMGKSSPLWTSVPHV